MNVQLTVSEEIERKDSTEEEEELFDLELDLEEVESRIAPYIPCQTLCDS